MKITIYSKKDCHLCDVAKEILHRFSAQYSFEFQEVDIESDPEIYAKYKEEIPVVFVEDRKLFKYRIDEQKLRSALEAG